MDLRAYLILEKIKNQFGEYGKINQKLLALTFIKQGHKLLEEKAIQGIDSALHCAGKIRLSVLIESISMPSRR